MRVSATPHYRKLVSPLWREDRAGVSSSRGWGSAGPLLRIFWLRLLRLRLFLRRLFLRFRRY